VSLINIIILTFIIISGFSLLAAYLAKKKKVQNHDSYTYWFSNVDELL